MNNYCTNCGNKLKEKDIICKKCKESVVDINETYIISSKPYISLTFLLIVFVFIIFSLYLIIKLFG